MDSLPDEVIVWMFEEYLKPSEVIICRSVCKRFRFLVDHLVNFKELNLLGDSGTFWCALRLLRSNAVESPLKNVICLHDKRIKWDKPIFFPGSPFKIPFARLKVLQVGIQLNLSRSLVGALNELDKLETLVLTIVKIQSKNRTPCLSLPNLKVLSIDDLDIEKKLKMSMLRRKIEKLAKQNKLKLIVTSKIETLFCSSPHFIQLTCPECLTHLESWSDLANIDLPSFKNLRTLKCPILHESNWNILDDLEHLEEIHLRRFNVTDEDCGQFVDHLMNRRAALGRSNVRIFFHNVSLTKPFKEYQFQRGYKGEGLPMQITHYRDLPDQGADTKWFSYDSVIRVLDDQAANLRMNGIALNEHGFPTCFFEKFPNIRSITQRHDPDSQLSNEAPFDEARFIWFVKQCRNLYDIQLDVDLCPSQYILDQLPDACGSLQVLTFLHHFRETGERRSEPDYAPLRRLKNLWGLTFCTQHLSEQLVEQLMGMIEDLQYLVQVTLKTVPKRMIQMKILKIAGLYLLDIEDFDDERNTWDHRNSYPREKLTLEALSELLANQIER